MSITVGLQQVGFLHVARHENEVEAGVELVGRDAEGRLVDGVVVDVHVSVLVGEPGDVAGGAGARQGNLLLQVCPQIGSLAIA